MGKRRKRKTMPAPPQHPGIWLQSEWCAAAGMGVSTWYTVPKELLPAHVRVGRNLRITEGPREWLERVAALGGVPSRSAA